MALVLSSAVHAAVLWPLVAMGWHPAAPPPEEPRAIEITLASLPAEEAAPPAAPRLLPPTPAPAPVPVPPPAAHPVAPAIHHAAPAPVAPAVHHVAPAPAPVSAAAVQPPPPAIQAAPQAAALPQPAAAPPAVPSDTLVAGYTHELQAQLERHKTYPTLALRRGEQGTVTVRITVAADGRVLDAQPLGDGPSLLVTATLEAVAAAQPFPPLPAGLGGQQMVFNLPMTYRLR